MDHTRAHSTGDRSAGRPWPERASGRYASRRQSFDLDSTARTALDEGLRCDADLHDCSRLDANHIRRGEFPASRGDREPTLRRSRLAIGDRKSRLARPVLTDDALDWTVVDLERGDQGGAGAQFEGIAAAGDSTLLVLSEDPPLVSVFGPDGGLTERITLVGGDRGAKRDAFGDSSSAGEGLLPLRDRRVLIAKEKDPAARGVRSPGCRPRRGHPQLVPCRRRPVPRDGYAPRGTRSLAARRCR